MLRWLYTHLHGGTLEQTEAALQWGALCLAFFFLLRASEYLDTGYHSPLRGLRGKADAGGSKTDVYNRGEYRNHYKTGLLLCPVKAAVQLFRAFPLRFAGGPEEEELLFRDAEGRPLPRTLVSTLICKAAEALGEPEGALGTHSLRFGGASALWAAFGDAALVKRWGRWTSESFQTYIWDARATSKDVARSFPLLRPGRGAFRETAHARRRTASTGANAVSSRSHAVCLLRIQRKGPEESREPTRAGLLVLVDCAGSERKKDSRGHSKEQQQESAEINASLYALKDCCRALASLPRVPPHAVRASSLTKVLAQAFLAQESRLAVICTVSPCASDTEHTVTTLRLGTALAGCCEQEEKDFLDQVPSERRGPSKTPKQWTPDLLLPILHSCLLAAAFGTRIIFPIRTMTPIGSPRVPSTVGSSLVMPVARDAAEPDDSAPAARLATPAVPAGCAAATPPHAMPAEVDQSALRPQVPPMPCAAVMSGNAHHLQPHALAADRCPGIWHLLDKVLDMSQDTGTPATSCIENTDQLQPPLRVPFLVVQAYYRQWLQGALMDAVLQANYGEHWLEIFRRWKMEGFQNVVADLNNYVGMLWG
ncbi:Kinesin-like protein KIF2A [Symbiodinium microadriaticum]|uniref:Kinesin-like protein KIF2A n=1 Tax=Symbiodinium microadriaticum TaxID=2951 RepID=A0A1Q9D3S0_SYMMI|nr:Kinesin-like protein KIF2A [Symbiodinium microadriaticum]